MKRIQLALAAVPIAFALAACGSSGSSAVSNQPTQQAGGGTTAPAAGTSSTPSSLPTSPGSVTIGSADFSESTVLAYIYGGAMAAKGVKVSYKPNIGERGVYMTALQDGSIGAVPEYSGSILDYLDQTATQKAPAAVYTQLKSVAAAKGLVPLNYAAAQDSDTITVTKATATKYHLKSIADLKPVAGKLTFGGPAQFKTRADGIPALKSVYGVTFGTFTTLSASGTATVTALKNGTIDAADIFSTLPVIAQDNFVPLTDTKHMFAAQNVVPLFSQKVLTKPMAAACNAVSAKLTTAALAKLNTQIANGTQPQAAAKAWLKKEKLG